jgi:predicted PurR-regulated permease PerM
MNMRAPAEEARAVSHPAVVVASKILIAVTLGALLYVARSAFIPVVLALLFWLVLFGPVESLHRRHVPRALSAVVIVLLVLAGIATLVSFMSTPAQEWFSRAPQTFATIRHKLGPVSRLINHLDDIRKSASSLVPMKQAAAAPDLAPAPAVTAPVVIFTATTSAIVSSVTFVIVTLFLLAGGPPMLARMTAAFIDNLRASRVRDLIEKVRMQVGHYYLLTTLINAGLGTATGLAMWAWGMPTPYLWGALAAILNFVPYAGAVTTLSVITIVAMISFDTLGQVLGVVGTQLLIATIEGQIAQPLLVGRRLNVNPLVIFLGLWFGGIFWGVAGIMLATPILVTLKVIAENTRDGQPMLEFLSPNPASPRIPRLRKLGKHPEG